MWCEEKGLTLLELLVVMIIASILMAVAVTSQLGARARASDSTARANLRIILPAIQAYGADHGGYTNLTFDDLRTYNASLNEALYSFGSPANLTATSYCIHSTYGGETWRKFGPGAEIEKAPCPDASGGGGGLGGGSGTLSAAEASVQAVVNAVDKYHAERGSYAGMTVAELQAYDPSLDAAEDRVVAATATTYCVESTVDGATWHRNGPGASIEKGSCP